MYAVACAWRVLVTVEGVVEVCTRLFKVMHVMPVHFFYSNGVMCVLQPRYMANYEASWPVTKRHNVTVPLCPVCYCEGAR